MHYEITINGIAIDTAYTWSELMQKYRARRKATKEPVLLEKVEDEDESNLQAVH